MPSVIVNWSGQCKERNVRLELFSYIKELAELSHSYYESPPTMTYFDESIIEGKILLSPNLIKSSARTIYSEIKERKLNIEVVPTGEEDEYFLLLESVGLHGLEFHLYDPRELYEDRMSFVCLCCDELPHLDGQLVMVEDKEECQFYMHETVRQSDWHLLQPSIHLRYYLEGWVDYLLGWIKYFFIPNLHFWRYVDLPGYSEFRKKLSNYGNDTEKSKKEIFLDIIEKFKSAASDW